MKNLLAGMLLMIGLVIYGQPTQVTLRIDDSNITNIQWFEFDNTTGDFQSIPLANADSLLIQQPGVYFATYSLPSCDKSTIPALVSCALGMTTIESIQLNASSPDSSSTYQWTRDGSILLDSTNASINTNMPGRYGVIIDKPACPLDTQLFDIVGLTCMDSNLIVEIEDPCNCDDPLNLTINDTFYFHDRVTVRADSNIIVRIDSINSSQIFDGTGQPIKHLTQLMEVSPGVYQLDFWNKQGIEFTVAVFGSNGLRDSLFSICTDQCLPVQPNCIANINISCGEKIDLQDVLTNYVSGHETILELSLFDQFNQPLANPLPLSYEGAFTIVVTHIEDGTTCMTNGEVSTQDFCRISNVLDTTIWCVDEFLEIDPDGDYYKDVLNLRPFAITNCGLDTLEIDYEGEWISSFECGDTLKQIIRSWRTESKDGNTCVAYDTITVIRLPDIADYIIAPQKDTVICTVDTLYSYEYSKSFVSWKQLVNLHNNGSEVLFPLEHSLYSDIGELYREWEALSNNVLKDSLRLKYESYPVLKRWISGTNTYDTYSVLDIYEDSLGQVFSRKQIDGQTYAVFSVILKDLIMSNAGSYLEVDDNWFYEEGEHGFWIDISYPKINYETHTILCDVWSSQARDKEMCVGLELLLPDHPYEPDSCKVFCLRPNEDKLKCLDVLLIDEKDLGKNCPRLSKKSITFKQSCIANGNQLARLSDVNSACPVMTDNSGIVSIRSLGVEGSTNISVEIEQWIVYMDTLGPLLADYEEPKSFVFLTEVNNCYGEIELPNIRLKDLCSGVKEVKATVGTGNPWIAFYDQDGDGEWVMDSKSRKIKISCGEEYQVHYVALDSCHNSTDFFFHNVSVQDRTNPVVLSPDTLSVNMGGQLSWIDSKLFDKGHQDNCGVAQVLVRRKMGVGLGLPAGKAGLSVGVNMEEICVFESEQDLQREMELNGLKNILSDSEIAKYYAEQYDWLVEEASFCELDGRESKESSLRELLIEGWHQDILGLWREMCSKNAEEFSTNEDFSLGGCWGSKVPLSCSDACQNVVVEILVIDKNCNYSKGWTVLNVTSQSSIVKELDFEDVMIGCSVYAEKYQSMVELANEGNQSAFDSLDEWFGKLQIAFKEPNGNLIDNTGNPIDRTIEYYSSECLITTEERKSFDTLHDGEVIWKTEIVGKSQLKRTTKVGILGVLSSSCGVDCKQSVWIDLDDCGHGIIKRRWDCQACESELQTSDKVIHSIEQHIRIEPSCSLNSYSVSWPADTSLCGVLEYDLDGRVKLNLTKPIYHLADSNCRDIALGYKDQVFEIVDEANIYKINRTWKLSDWCGQEEIEYVQKIILKTDCQEVSTIEGMVMRRDEQTPMGGVSIVNLESGSRVISDIDGYYKINDAETIQLQFDSEPKEGIDIRDILMIQRQILEEYTLTQYENLAADVNSDSQVDISDLIIIRELLLDLRTGFPGMNTWKFYHLPSLEPSYTRKSKSGIERADFVAIKMGDVIESSASLSRTVQKVALRTPNIKLSKGEEVEIIFEAEAALEGFQLNLGIMSDFVELIDVQGKDNNSLGWQTVDLSSSMKGVKVISTSEVMKVKMLVYKDTELKEVISLIDDQLLNTNLGDNPSIMNNLAVLNPKRRNHRYKFDSNNDVRLELVCFELEEELKFALYQNVPNPFTDQTNIGFVLPDDMRATLTLFDAQGKVLHRIEGFYTKGEHSESIERAVLSSADLTSAVIFYQLETQDYSATKQMLLVK